MFSTLVLRLCAVLLLVAAIALSSLVLLRPAQPGPLLSVTGFDAFSGTGSGLWLRDVEREARFQLLKSDRLLYSLWLPDGNQLAYFFDDPLGTAVYIHDLTTGRTVTGPIMPRLLALSWSPDGQWLLLYNFSTNQIIARSRSGTQLGQPLYIATGSADALWSPDSQHVYFRDTSGTPSAIDIRCLEQRGLCLPQVVPSEQDVAQLAGWMPDGEHLMVFSGRRETGQPDLFSLDPVDGAMRRIAEYLLPGTLPAWSPDGQLLALSLALPPNEQPSPGSEPIPGVYVTERDGRPELLWTGIAGELGWSPAGKRLAFELVSRVGNDRSVWVYERSSGGLTRLTPAGEHEAAPHWVLFPGRTFDALPLLALCGLVAVALWAARAREANETN